MKKVIPPASETFARIRVIGIGGAGKNATNFMIKTGVAGVEFIAANTDAQDLQNSKADKRVHLGKRTTQGLGAGMNPALGKNAAEESISEINEILKGADLVFITCGMGGGTGTGAAPVVAKAAKDLNILTVGVVTKPFTFEGGKRRSIASDGLSELMQNTDSIVIIPNDNILSASDNSTTMAEAFSLSDKILHQAVSGISQLIMKPGDINIDFADIKTILEDSGVSLLGLGAGKGNNRAELAVSRAISSPLLETSIAGAERVLFSVASRSRSDIAMREIQTIAQNITESVDPNAKIIFGTTTDKDLKQGEIHITLIATAFNEEHKKKKEDGSPESLRQAILQSEKTDTPPPEEEKMGDTDTVVRLSDYHIEDEDIKNDLILDDLADNGKGDGISTPEKETSAWKKLWKK